MKINFDKLINYINTTNINATNIEIYIEPESNWILDYDDFNIILLNFTWDAWKFQNQSKDESEIILDRNSTNLNLSSLNDFETILLINFTFNSPPNISPTKV